jgi:hypothetical protein
MVATTSTDMTLTKGQPVGGTFGGTTNVTNNIDDSFYPGQH